MELGWYSRWTWYFFCVINGLLRSETARVHSYMLECFYGLCCFNHMNEWFNKWFELFSVSRLLLNTCILPIFLYGAETWSVAVILSRTIDALDNWCLRRILNIHWSEFVTNDGQHWAAISVRHCPQPSSVLHWTSLPSRPRTGSSPSSPGLHCGPTWQLETEDWSSKAILAQNCIGRPATYESWTGDCEATRSGSIGLAETRGNGYVISDTFLKNKIITWGRCEIDKP